MKIERYSGIILPMSNTTAKHTEYQGIYDLTGHIVVKVNHGLGIEWALHSGTVEQYFDNEDRWIATLPTLKLAKEQVA